MLGVCKASVILAEFVQTSSVFSNGPSISTFVCALLNIFHNDTMYAELGGRRIRAFAFMDGEGWGHGARGP